MKSALRRLKSDTALETRQEMRAATVRAIKSEIEHRGVVIGQLKQRVQRPSDMSRTHQTRQSGPDSTWEIVATAQLPKKARLTNRAQIRRTGGRIWVLEGTSSRVPDCVQILPVVGSVENFEKPRMNFTTCHHS